MAETMSAHPRGESVLARRLWMARDERAGYLTLEPFSPAARGLQLIGAAAILVATAYVAIPNQGPMLATLFVLSVLVILYTLPARGSFLARSQLPENEAPATDIATADASSPADVTQREIALERQSQRLVEIADAAIRARQAADVKGQTWAELMARVSHELRTPLNAVIGFSDVMNAELFGPVGHPRYREYLDHIRDSGRALLKSTEDTLALTTLLAQPGNQASPDTLNFADIVHDAWTLLAPDRQSAALSLDLEAPLGLEVLGERRPVRQALANMLAAAAARGRDGQQVRVSAEADGDLVEIEVRLSGPPLSGSEGCGALAICVARALLELQGASLIEIATPTGGWRLVTVLGRAAQPDFFACPAAGSSAGAPTYLL